jgi:hypothetical protein
MLHHIPKTSHYMLQFVLASEYNGTWWYTWHIVNNFKSNVVTCFSNNPTKINVFLLHQPCCEFRIKRIPKCTPFMNFPPIDEILPIVDYEFLDGS